MNRNDCPSQAELQRLVTGHLLESRTHELAEHIALCVRCSTVIESLASHDPLLAAVREQAVNRPVIAPELGRLMERLGEMGRALCDPPNQPGRSTPPPGERETLSSVRDLLDAPIAHDELGRIESYRVRDVIGQGGMGVVLRAHDTRLNRIVAIKLIRDVRSLDSQYLSRFVQEGKSLARLQHPNIVRVFEVGQHRERLYLVLEFIEGGTLASFINDRPQLIQPSVRLLAKLARAVQHAHEHGVVHRDLKPANVLLSGSEPKIADFGLARHVDEQGVTQTGDLLGTPNYMAPELTRGSVGASANLPLVDVYSLGAILYELLTGQPPFRGATIPDIFEQVRNLDPVSPRRLQPRVPRELETICIKCLEKDPARRFRTAGELADDLERFLDGRPILACPAGHFELLLKWAKRRPALAALAVVSAVASVAILVGGLAYERRLQTALQVAQANATAALDAQTLAEANRARADASYREARETLHRMKSTIADRGLADIPKLRELQRRLLEHSLAFYVSAAKQSGEDPDVRFEAAQAASEAGELQSFLGQLDQARMSYRQALREFETLSKQHPDDLRYTTQRAGALTNLAELCIGKDELPEAIRLGQESAKLFESCSERQPESDSIRSGLATAHFVLAAAFFAARSTPAGFSEVDAWIKSEQHYLQAHDLLRALSSDQKDDVANRSRLARTQVNLSVLYQQRFAERQADCQKFHDLAEETLSALSRDHPHDSQLTCDLALLRLNWAYVLDALDEPEQGLADLAKNIVALQSVLKHEPQVAMAREMLYRSHGVRASILDARKRFSESADDWKSVVALSSDADRPKHRILFALTLARTDRFSEAVAEADALAMDPAVRDDAQFLWNLAKICSLAMASFEHRSAHGNADSYNPINEYVSKARGFLSQAKSVAEKEQWLQLASELMTDDGFESLRSHDKFSQFQSTD